MLDTERPIPINLAISDFSFDYEIEIHAAIIHFDAALFSLWVTGASVIKNRGQER